MKKIRSILLFTVLSFLFFALITNALSNETDYINIYDGVDISLDEITLKNAHFDNPTDLRNLVTEIYNDGSGFNEYKLVIFYYDSNYSLLGDSSAYDITNASNKVSFAQNFYNIEKNEIKYFKLNISSNPSNPVIDNQESQSNTAGDYYISDYDINIIVNENNTFDITEKITAYFNVAKYGIYRNIPIRNKITRLDGTKSNNRAKITNIIINEKYKSYNKNGYKVLQIGDLNETINGSHTYNISYTYNIGKDPLKNADELYFNLIGTEWDTSINNITFTITMPKEFDSTKLGFSSGDYGSTDNSSVNYEIDGNVIKGKLLEPLNANKALTVRLTLPEGYFVGASYNVNIYSIILIAISLIFIIIAFVIWYKFGRDDKLVETVEFYPPSEYNSAEIAYLFKGNVTSKEIVSLLIYLANKGYLKIEEHGERITGLFSKEKDFKITKLKEYDGSNEYEKIFFNELFKGQKKANIAEVKKIMNGSKQNGNKISFYQALLLSNENEEIKNSVTGDDLYDNFYVTINKVRKGIIKDLKPKIFKLYSDKVKILIAMIIIIFILVLIPPLYEINSGLYLIQSLLVILIFPMIGLYLIISEINIEKKISGGIIGGSIFIGIILIPVLISYTLDSDLSFIFSSIIAIISIIVLIIFIALMPKRTEYGNKILGKIKSFRNFLVTAEKNQLESLVNQNPEYFYNILPYTYALNVSEIWMKQFETISMQSPKWYDSTSIFDVSDFNNFINSTMQSVQSTMTSSSSSSSGGSSGGGSSGGGSGGGGGGSW